MKIKKSPRGITGRQYEEITSENSNQIANQSPPKYITISGQER